MKKYLVILIPALIILVCGCGIALANSDTQDGVDAADVAAEEEMIADWLETIEAAGIAIQYGPESVLDDDADIITTAEEAAEVYEEYEAGLDDIFTESEKEACINYHEDYAEGVEMREEIIDASNQYLSEFVGYGYFDVEMLYYTIDGDTAVMNVVVSIWAKSVDQCGESEFKSVFMVNKCIEEVHMVFEDGVWKLDKYNIVSALLMDGDYSLEQTFSTYEEAVEYAQSVTPKNVLANETVEMNK